jgi:hypothetical protein
MEDDIRIIPREMGPEIVDWICIAQDRFGRGLM